MSTTTRRVATTAGLIAGAALGLWLSLSAIAYVVVVVPTRIVGRVLGVTP